MHAAVREWMTKQIGIELRQRGLERFRSVLEVGSRNVNGSVREFIPADRYLGIDVCPGPGVDLVADGSVFEPADGEWFDLVVCCETLEHAESAPSVAKRCVELLAPGGVCLITVAGPTRAPHSALDGGPLRPWEWYRGVPVLTLYEWLEGAGAWPVVAKEYPDRGDVYARAVKPLEDGEGAELEGLHYTIEAASPDGEAAS